MCTCFLSLVAQLSFDFNANSLIISLLYIFCVFPGYLSVILFFIYLMCFLYLSSSFRYILHIFCLFFYHPAYFLFYILYSDCLFLFLFLFFFITLLPYYIIGVIVIVRMYFPFYILTCLYYDCLFIIDFFFFSLLYCHRISLYSKINFFTIYIWP